MARGKIGRPSSFTPEIAAEICEAIATTDRGLAHLCRERDGWPSTTTIHRWLAHEGPEYDEFRAQYARSRERQAERMAYDVVAIADDGRRDWKPDPRDPDRMVPDYDHIQRSKLRCDARKWAAAHLAPKVWGDRASLEIGGSSGGPVRQAIEVTYVSPEDRDPEED